MIKISKEALGLQMTAGETLLYGYIETHGEDGVLEATSQYISEDIHRDRTLVRSWTYSLVRKGYIETEPVRAEQGHISGTRYIIRRKE